MGDEEKAGLGSELTSLIPIWAVGFVLSFLMWTIFLYSWASLVAQTVKNLPAMWETWVRPLSREEFSSILAWRIPKDKEAWQATLGSQKVGHD